MNEEVKISVLIPCFNASKFINEAVDSILNQTYRNLEILLIDDGSSDNTRDIIMSYAEKDARVVPVFNKRNLGLIRTLNKAVKIATGDFMARMDADDRSHPERLEILMKAFQNDPALDVISAAYYYMSDSGRVLRLSYPKAFDSRALYFVSFFCTPVLHPCVMVKSSVFRDNVYDENFIHSEDYEIFSRLLVRGYKFLNIEQPLYYLRINPQSVSFKYETIQISTHTKISVRNIEDYFNIRYDFFQHKVMINRISFNVSALLLLKSIKALDELRDEFIKREAADEITISEINGFLIEQKMDIFFQAIKYATWINKFILFTLMVMKLGLFMNARGYRYFKSKFNFLALKQFNIRILFS